MTFTAQELANVAQGSLLPPGAAVSACGLSIDTRTLRNGQAFAAIPGQQVDGHEFCAQAAGLGASFVIVERDVELPSDGTQVVVGNTTQALADLGRHLRRRTGLSVVGITGSAGKTTTKNLTAAALGVEASPGNYNTVYGLALALANLPDATDRVVLEMGISQPGEMVVLTEMVEPDVMVLTNVSHAHTEFFPTLEDLAEEKVSSLRGLRAAGGVVWNGDDALLDATVDARIPADARRLRFGSSEQVDLRLVHQESKGFGQSLVECRFPGGEARSFTLALSGRHNALNALAALGAGLLLDLDLSEMIDRICRVEPAPGRGRVLELDGITVLDESYNANPRAMEAALATMAAGAGTRRRIAVLGDMLELGESSPEHHASLGRRVAESGVALFLGVGPEMEAAVRTAKAAGVATGLEALHFADAASAGRELASRCRSGDVVLVKGSRSIGTEHAIDALRHAFDREETD